jgi:molybdate transport system regulatory protein
VGSDLTVRFRVDFGTQCSVGIGKIELLEAIAICGSLSAGARQLKMSYRRAWLLLEDMNVSFDEHVALTSTGGRGGGGAVLTPFGKRLVARYRAVESALQPLAAKHLQDFVKCVQAPHQPPAKKSVPVVSLRRKPHS